LQRIQNITKRDEAKSQSKRTRTSKAPKVADDTGLTLDNWLDILGVGLTFGSLVLFFSAISSEQAAISGIHTFFGQLFGWGALAVPITMFAIGMWLIIRHFGDDAPTVDPIRVTGLGVFFVMLLVFFQYLDSFTYQAVTSLELLRMRLDFAWRIEQSGGGIVGAELYYWLVSTLTEIGGFLIIVLGVIIATMLITRMSAAELVEYGRGMWRNTRDGMAKRAAASRARKAKRELELEEKRLAVQASGQVPDITIERPAPAQLQAGTAGALPDPNAQGARNIRFNMGGQLQNVNANAMAQLDASGQTMQGVPQQNALPNFQMPAVQTASSYSNTPQSDPNNSNSSGISSVFGALGGLLGSSASGGNTGNQPPPLPPAEIPTNPLPMDDPLPPYAGNGYNPSYGAQALPPAQQPVQQPMQQPQQPVQPQQPAQPSAQPQQPAAYTPPTTSNNEEDIFGGAGDFSKADDTSYDTNPTFNADRAQAKLGLGDSSVSSAPSSGAPTFGQPTPSNEPFDPVKARQDRLNALRQGKSQQPTPQQPLQPQ
jgi:hypothetical protein